MLYTVCNNPILKLVQTKSHKEKEKKSKDLMYFLKSNLTYLNFDVQGIPGLVDTRHLTRHQLRY